jgi:mutator protein MutT
VRVGAEVQALSRRHAAGERLSPEDRRNGLGGGSGSVIHVVAAAVTDATGRVLIAQRPAGKHLAGGWEFPGGKLEPGEDRQAGLARELREELGISLLGTPRPLIRLRHTYPARKVLLDVWVVRRYGGEPRGLDGQALRWCAQEELASVELLPADGPIVRALRLPERLAQMASRYYCVGDLSWFESSAVVADADDAPRLRGVFSASAEEGSAAASAGADFLVIRNVLADEELKALCRIVSVPVYARGVALERAWELGASGVSEI